MQFRMSGESDPGDGDAGDILPAGGANFYQQNTSDDSDNEQEMYEGYEPLNGDASNVEVWDNQDAVNVPIPLDQEVPPSDIPVVETVDSEVQREVWNAPRPEGLSIDLDGDKERQIMNVMAGFSLPATAIPTWAQGVTEKEWKDDLLKRIRDRKTQ